MDDQAIDGSSESPVPLLGVISRAVIRRGVISRGARIDHHLASQHGGHQRRTFLLGLGGEDRRSVANHTDGRRLPHSRELVVGQLERISQISARNRFYKCSLKR